MIIFLIIYSLIGICYATFNVIHITLDDEFKETVKYILTDHNWLRIWNMTFIVLFLLLMFIIEFVAWPICISYGFFRVIINKD